MLGPPLLTGSEATNWRTTYNSTVELSYRFYGLRTAQLWRERLGLPREAKWDEVLAKLSQPPVVDGLCVDAEGIRPPREDDPIRERHVPASRVVRGLWLHALLRDQPCGHAGPTFALVWQQVGEGHRWMFWGCDFPMMAMTAARLGKPEAALDALLADHPNNVVQATGSTPPARCRTYPAPAAYSGPQP